MLKYTSSGIQGWWSCLTILCFQDFGEEVDAGQEQAGSFDQMKEQDAPDEEMPPAEDVSAQEEAKTGKSITAPYWDRGATILGTYYKNVHVEMPDVPQSSKSFMTGLGAAFSIVLCRGLCQVPVESDDSLRFFSSRL